MEAGAGAGARYDTYHHHMHSGGGGGPAAVFLPAPEFVTHQGMSCVAVAAETFKLMQLSGFGWFGQCSSAGPVQYTEGWCASLLKN